MDTTTLQALIQGANTMSEAAEARRLETLGIAAELGADEAVLRVIAEAVRVKRNSSTIVLPAHRYEGLSRGRGWARKGRGNTAEWGERTDDGYRVGPGRWTVGGHDGFSRKGQTEWSVKHVQVGDQTWTVAS